MPKSILVELGGNKQRLPRYVQGKHSTSRRYKLLTRNRAVIFTVLALGFASLSVQASAAAEKKHKPEETAVDFIAQFYGVMPEQVNVTILKQKANVATAITKTPGQPTCSLELAFVPHSAAKYDWLVGGIACDKGQQLPGKG